MKHSLSHLLFKNPLIVGFSTFIILLFTSQYIAYQKFLINENEQKKEINNQVNIIKEKLQAIVMYSYSSTRTLGYIIERNGIPDDFDTIARELLKGHSYFDAVQLVDGEGFITHVYPLKGNEVIGYNIFTSTTASSGALETIERKDFFIAGPVRLKQGGVGIISRYPIYINGKFEGFSAVITKLSTFLNDLNINTSEENDFLYQLSRVNFETGEEEFFLENDMSSYKSYAVPIELTFGEWKLYVIPLQKNINTAIWFAIIGFLMAIMLSWSAWYFTGQSERINNLINTKLEEQEYELNTIHETTRKQIEKSELLYRTLTSYAPVAIFNTNEEGECTYVNEEWMKYSGMEFNEALRYGWTNAIYPDDKDRVMDEWQEAVSNNSEFQSEFRFLNKNGKITWLSAKATKLVDSNNNLLGHIGIAIDVSERVKNEKELLHFKRDLEKLVSLRTDELSESKEALLNLLEDMNLQSIELEKEKVKAQSADLMKSAFLATMSHELRTPMNSIIGFTSLLLKEYAGPLNQEQAKQLAMVKNSGQHLLGLINDILDISKIEAGELTVSFQEFDFVESLTDIIDFLSPQAISKKLVIKTDLHNEKVILKSDKRRVEQVLLNLISNAIKFSEKGTIFIKVNLVDSMLCTQVIDEGIGISKENLVKLFVPFIQLNGGLARSHEGTGLGLAISKNLIEKLGGTIKVESELGKGSTFTFCLPLEL
ncbi:PAS domain S-box protein [Aureisphaera sp. CAU 1614]|uniref:histidine kinase n=1 Tax=Halomarinibacterium sedimenti TaxID=2857106 RepID=A0A9X1K085_9FLAO|nr:ATP-binding protein [Halomarinibacterium sedimenti]MBW2938176.1 PAS domain S-box protein [Halomarinibacterium sedimenti]